MTRPLPPWRFWFSGRAAICPLPPDCIADCSGPGRADDAVAYWCRRLYFDAPPWLQREHLRGYGAWDRSELCDHNANRERLLWIWACDAREQQDPNFLPFLQ
jgi:hypothetical protein